MKKLIVMVLTMVTALCLCFGLAACELFDFSSLNLFGSDDDTNDTHAHTLTYTEAVAATCTEAGNTAYYYCSECGKYYSDGSAETEITLSDMVVAALGHDYAGTVTKEAACAEEGVLTYICIRCGDSYTETISALGHTAGEAVNENEVAATCTTDGSYDTVVYCTVCSEELSRETITISAPGHTAGEAVRENEKAATCIEDGSYDTVVYCTVCGEELSRGTETISAPGHTAGEAVKENEKAATCTTDGSYDTVVYCSVCNTELSRETTATPAPGHTYNGYSSDESGHWQVCTACGEKTASESHTFSNDICTVCGYEKGHTHSYTAVVTLPTCTEQGYTTYTCSECGDSYVSDYTDALGHTAGEKVTENEKAATCTTDGSYDMVVYCSVCNTELSRETTAIPAPGHTYNSYSSDENGHWKVCTACGEKTASESHTFSNDICTVCGYEKGHTHSYTAVVTLPTCTEQGYTTYTCSECGDSYVSDYTDALGHTAGEAVRENEKAATCTTDGNYDMVVYCSVCNAELSRETTIIPAPGHTWDDGVITTEPTCTETGVKTYFCTVCMEMYTETIAAFGHDYVGKTTVAATCITTGIVTYTCTRCSDTYTEVIPVNDSHSLAYVEAKEAVCGVAGNYAYWYCTDCGKYFTDEDGKNETTLTALMIDALEHNYADETTKEATCTEDGVVTYTCTLCGDVQTETIAAFGHTYTYNSYIGDESGHWQVCTVCGTATASESHTYSYDVCTVCGYENSADHPYIRISSEYLYFGSYPQTEVTDTELTAELLTLAGTLPTSENSYNWTSYGYYISGSNSTDYMWYIDRTYDGTTYRGVYFTNYRPYWTTESSSRSYQDDNGYYTGTVYWFRYDRIKWRILAEETSGEATYATILCEMLIDSQEYHYTASSQTIDETTIYANNYAYSSIRAWLNDNFYNTAFSSLEQAIIQTVTVDNSASTTADSRNSYACADTLDKVWLLSYQDVLNAEYGFSSRYSTLDTARKKQPTDYALSQGCYTSTNTSYYGNGNWWLRSPSWSDVGTAGYSDRAREVDIGGGVSSSLVVYKTDRGICPALKIILA